LGQVELVVVERAAGEIPGLRVAHHRRPVITNAAAAAAAAAASTAAAAAAASAAAAAAVALIIAAVACAIVVSVEVSWAEAAERGEHPAHDGDAAVHMELRDVLPREAAGPVEPQQDAAVQGLTLVPISAQLEPSLTQNTP
jgi:hypothetical protein